MFTHTIIYYEIETFAQPFIGPLLQQSVPSVFNEINLFNTIQNFSLKGLHVVCAGPTCLYELALLFSFILDEERPFGYYKLYLLALGLAV